MSDLLRVALLGAGHLGGSFALALKEAGADITIAAYDRDAAHGALLLARGAIDRIAHDVADAVADADIIMLATPLRTYRALAQAMHGHTKPGTIITDLGSVKGSMAALASLLPNARLVPGHPIAGGEKSGAAVARGDLFRGRLCILTPEAADSEAVETVEMLWHLTGADVLHMPAAVHDAVYAHVSHLPHLIAFVAAECLFLCGVEVAPDDALLQQFLRISRSNPRMWADIFLENREALLPALGTYIALLEHFAKELTSGENDTGEAPDLVATRFVPRILASCLISGVSLYEQQSGMALRPFGGAGMRDIVAPAAADPEPELEHISRYARAVAADLEYATALLREFASIIGEENESLLLALIEKLVAHAHALVSPRQ